MSTYVIGLFVALQALDILTTVVGLSRDYAELNPLHAMIGSSGFFAVKIAFVVYASCVLRLFTVPRRLNRLIGLVLVCGTALLCISNLFQLFQHW